MILQVPGNPNNKLKTIALLYYNTLNYNE